MGVNISGKIKKANGGLLTGKHVGRYSAYFDGNGDYVETAYDTSDFDWSSSGEFTIETWIYPTDLSKLSYFAGTEYTSNFSVPTVPLEDIAGTSLLTFNTDTIVDNSSNSTAMATFGDTVVVNDGPFA